MTDQSNEQGLGCVSWNDDASIHATTQKSGARSDAEVATMIEAAVAAVAVGLEDGLNALGVERYGVGSGSVLRGDIARLP